MKIKKASLQLSQSSEADKDMFIKCLIEIIEKNKIKIINANMKDVKKAMEIGLIDSLIQRLILDKKGIEDIVKKLIGLKKMQSGLGEILESKKLENGIVLKKVVSSLGVILVIYESRPEVTIDVATLCIKSGNAAILKGGSEASNTNKALYHCIQTALMQSNFSKETVSYINDKDSIYSLLEQYKSIDLVIARGGYEMVENIMVRSKIPVLAHASGGARIYIDKSADLSIVEKIIINSKTSKPAACNSLDTILVHQDIAGRVIPVITKSLEKNNVKILNNHWDQEFLDLKVGIKIVKDISEAINFVNKFTKKHSEGIVAKDKIAIDKFKNSVDAAAIFINCSTRFHDGYEFGMGAEMGISTGKLHARGPVGLRELTTYKWEAYGNGHIR